MAKKASKPKTRRKAVDADAELRAMLKRLQDPEYVMHAELRAMLERLQDPDYVMQVIRQCQEHGLIPKDAE